MQSMSTPSTLPSQEKRAGYMGQVCSKAGDPAATWLAFVSCMQLPRKVVSTQSGTSARATCTAESRGVRGVGSYSNRRQCWRHHAEGPWQARARGHLVLAADTGGAGALEQPDRLTTADRHSTLCVDMGSSATDAANTAAASGWCSVSASSSCR